MTARGMTAAPERPDCIELGPRPGLEPSTKPAVRIFVGTEPAQYRAERTFVWSIEGLRDPTRTYRIYFMRELQGFDRRRWLTGFTGSAGVAIVTEKGSSLFVDGRYILQAPKQVDTKVFEVLQVPEAKPSSWLVDKLARGNAVGYDPALHTIKEIERLTKTLSAAGIKLNPVAENPIDAEWGEDRPEPSSAQIFLQPF